MNKKTITFLLTLSIICVGLIYITTRSKVSPILVVENGYVRGLPSSTTNTSAYMTIMNLSNQDLVLTGASSAGAASVTIHQTMESAGMMNMRHRANINIPAKSNLILQSGGYHLMLMDLVAPLTTKDMVAITLYFEGGIEHSLHLPVRSVLDE